LDLKVATIFNSPTPQEFKERAWGQGKAANVGKGLKASRTCLNHSMEVISPASTKFARGFVWGLHAECNGWKIPGRHERDSPDTNH
jgi:hypothetical protein